MRATDRRLAVVLLAVATCLTSSLRPRGAAAQGIAPRGDWRTLTTPHFRVHFVGALEEPGRRAAADAEAAWALLSRELTPPRGRVDLVLSDNADVSNGFATTLPSNRIVIYAQPPVDVLSLRFYDDWLQLVITHELTHVFHLDRAGGIWRLGRSIFGRAPGLFPNAYGPSWLTEGLAVYFESRLTSSGRLLGTEHRLVARAAAADGRLPRLDQLSLAGSVFPLGERAYAYGSLVVDYAAKHGGPQNVQTFVNTQSGQLLPWRLDRAARNSFGFSLTDAWRRWGDSVTASVARGPVAPAWRELTDAGWFAESPRWIDGRTILFAKSDGRAVANAERVTVDGGATRGGRRNDLSPNALVPGVGTFFTQIDYTAPFTIRSDLYVEDDSARDPGFGAGTRGQRRLTYGARLSHVDARRDGALVAVQSAAATTWLVRVTPDGRTIVPITRANADTQWTEPRWSPDGGRIVAVRLARGARSAIVVLDSTGRPLFDVARDRSVNSGPAWSSDGTRIYWSSDRTGAPQLYAAEVSATARRGPVLRLTSVTTGLTEPAPAGDRLAGMLYRSNGVHVVVAESLLAVPASNDSSYFADASRVAPTAARSDAPLARYSPWRSLLPRYWTPAGATSDGGSVLLGAATSGSDVLGRHAYVAQLLANVDNGDLEGGASYRYTRFVRPIVDVGASQSWLYDSVAVRFTNGTVDTLALSRRARVASLALTFARPRFRTNTSLSVGASYEGRSYLSPNASVQSAYENRLGTAFPAVFVSGAWSNARRPRLSVSPEDGVSLSGSVQQRWQNGRLGPQSRRAIGAARLYKSLDLPGFSHHAIALRVAGGVTDAKTATELTAGGVNGSSAAIAPGVSFGTSARTFGVRGFAPSAQQGIRAAAAALEYRAPLAVPARGAKLLPVFLDRVSLTVFGDAGTSWCPSSVDRTAQPLCRTDGSGAPSRRSPTAPSWMASAGAELDLDTALSYDASFRFRLGAAAPVARRELAPRAVSPYVTVGLSF